MRYLPVINELHVIKGNNNLIESYPCQLTPTEALRASNLKINQTHIVYDYTLIDPQVEQVIAVCVPPFQISGRLDSRDRDGC